MAHGGFSLFSDHLVTHRQRLDGIADSLSHAGSTAGGLGAPPSAFGVIGEFIPGLLQPLVDEAGQVIKAGAESVSTTAAMINRTIDTYHEADEQARSGLAQLKDQV